MIKEISLILLQFRDCFNGTTAFNWFVIIIMGFIVRLDHHGVTSIIRWLGLDPSLFAVGPVFLILRTLTSSNGGRFVHLVTRAKSNVVGYEDPPL